MPDVNSLWSSCESGSCFRSAELIATDTPVVLTGDYNVIPTEIDAYKPERWLGDALFFPESRAAYQRLLAQGWVDALRTYYPTETIYTYWDYFRDAFSRNAAGVDRDVRGWEKTSDHAPTWVELAG